MIYGLYLSATGVITSAYRQDLISNNLANAQTVGFKRDLATFYQRQTADRENPTPLGMSSELLDKIGGGTLTAPTMVDQTQGTLESTGGNLDVAINGKGYLTVAAPDGTQRLTRDGQFNVNTDGQLTLMNSAASPVLDSQGQPIKLDPTLPVTIGKDGLVSQGGQAVARLGFVETPDGTQLQKDGGSLMRYPDGTALTPATGQLNVGFLEGSNVDPAMELSQLIETQRQLEANANMIHYQDQTMDDLVNTVGKIS
jgi:flagellar basal-body rod protein FlgF